MDRISGWICCYQPQRKNIFITIMFALAIHCGEITASNYEGVIREKDSGDIIPSELKDFFMTEEEQNRFENNMLNIRKEAEMKANVVMMVEVEERDTTDAKVCVRESYNHSYIKKMTNVFISRPDNEVIKSTSEMYSHFHKQSGFDIPDSLTKKDVDTMRSKTSWFEKRYHSCCTSESHWKVPSTGVDIEGSSVIIVQGEFRKQFVKYQTCGGKKSDCAKTHCKCLQLDPHLTRVVIHNPKGELPKFIVRTIHTPGCCKCING